MSNREMKTFTTRVIDSVTGVITAETFDIVDDKARGDLSNKVDKVTGKGLSENDYTNADKAIVDGVTTALASKVDTSSVGVASGVAELDANGKVPSSQLPSFVDDVKEGYLNSADGKFYEESTYETEITPEADKIYMDKATNITYRWSGSAFVGVGSDLALGETSTTAYRGDRGKAAYDHASDAGKISTATASGFYKVGATAEGHVSNLTAVAKADITALGIPDADDLGTAAAKDFTTSVTSGSDDLVTSDAVYTSLSAKADKSTYKSATLAAGSTTVTFTGIPTSGNYIVSFYTSNGANYTAINTATAGQAVLTFDKQSAAITVYCEIKEV